MRAKYLGETRGGKGMLGGNIDGRARKAVRGGKLRGDEEGEEELGFPGAAEPVLS